MTDVMRPMDNASDSPSYATGPVALSAPRPVVKGAAPASHPELSQSHPDAVKARVAIPPGEASAGLTSSPAELDAHAPAAGWSTQKLATGGE